MAVCTGCPHNADVQAGKYKELVWEKTPCARCELEEKAMFCIEYDEDRLTAAEEGKPVASQVEEQDDAELLLPVSILTEVVNGLLSLSPEQRDVVCMRHAGMRYKEIAEKQGVTTAAAEVRHTRALKKWPALQAFFSGKSRKQTTRRRAGAPPSPPALSATGRRRGGWRRCGNGHVRSTGATFHE